MQTLYYLKNLTAIGKYYAKQSDTIAFAMRSLIVKNEILIV
jgi:hypothetical protein